MLKVGIFGASGFTGGELIRILLKHQGVELTFLGAATQAGKPVVSVHPGLKQMEGVNFDSLDIDEALRKADFFFIALPHSQAVNIVPSLVSAGKKVVDLTADFRLKNPQEYPSWYGFSHPHPELLDLAVYGLPELYREEIKKAHLVANPGCYPTAIILGLAPLLMASLEVKNASIVAVSGASGAGRGKNDLTLLSILSENLVPYKVGYAHQHLPEIEEQIKKIKGQSLSLSFCPIIGPYSRGILAIVFLTFSQKLDISELRSLEKKFYQNSYFVEVLDEGDLPQLKSVRGTNLVEISLVEGKAESCYLLVSLDNLVKGAAGQAVQNMNLMAGFAETEALDSLALYP